MQTEDGRVKIPLAWILDRVLGLKGYKKGSVRLFEKQPIVIVADENALSQEVNALADEVKKLVQEKIGIEIEREVETLHAIKLSTHR